MKGEKAVRGAPCSHPLPTRAALGTSLNEATPTRRARPAGVLGAEVWVKLVEPNGQMPNGQMTKSEDELRTLGDIARAIGDPSTFSFLTMTTKPTFRADFKLGEDGNREF